jgi:ATP citrate (pro-S)-lyase
MGVLNGLFILGRSVGLIAHHLDQKRLKTGLYRHPWDDISCKRFLLTLRCSCLLFADILPNMGSLSAPGADGRVEVKMN